MKDLGIKNKILDDIISMMDERDGEDLKKHPKLMSAKVEVVKPKVIDLNEELGEEKESPVMDELIEKEDESESEDDVSPEMIAKLMELIKDKE